ncbi:citrate/2-methylcitrate synthase [Cupriavidus sp. RAF12]|uniref:citrate/2-methylcitrate synthase n=1 Tax=Cupriavidus sp. RAF12 TaxID=3233050 RepID=UPI003F91DCAA
MTFPDYLDRKAVVEALGIKPATLYAYVSRGLLRRVRSPDGRNSLYLREDVERLSTRHRGLLKREDAAAGSMRWGMPVISTGITYIDANGPTYRHRSALDLARSGVSFEAVVHLLMTGGWQPAMDAWPPIDTPADVKRRLDAECRTLEAADLSKVLATAVLWLGMQSRGQDELSAASGEHARRIVQTLAGCFGGLGPQRKFIARKDDESIAALVLRAARIDASAQALSTVNQTLIVLADHELAAASFVSRITASTESDLFCCVAAALCAHAGSTTVAATAAIDDKVFTPLTRRNQKDMLALVRHRGTTLFGFNHPLYPRGDPRADYLLALAADLPPTDPKTPELLAFLRLAREDGVMPGIAVALAVLARALGLPAGGASALWILSRSAGWVAHALEQRTQGFMMRPRAKFIGTGGTGGMGDSALPPTKHGGRD